MSNEAKLLVLRHKLRCLKEKQKQIETEIEDTKEQITFKQNKLLKEKQNEPKQIERVF